MKDSLCDWSASRLLTKNETMSTRSGGSAVRAASRAVFPAYGFARIHR